MRILVSAITKRSWRWNRMPETKMVETGRVELIVRVPNLSQENAQIIARDARFALENSAKLNLLNEFVVIRAMEYIEK